MPIFKVDPFIDSTNKRICGFSLGTNPHPTGICGSCETNLYFKRKGKTIGKAAETSWLNGRQLAKELERGNQVDDSCSCAICRQAQD